VSRETAGFLGVYEHFYADNFRDEPGFGTHYVVLDYELDLDVEIDALPVDQHGDYRWLSVDKLTRDHDVHANTRAYFVTT